MTVRTWYTYERAEGLARHPEQIAGTVGRCAVVDIEQGRHRLAVTVAADSPRACLAEFRKTADTLNIHANKWSEFPDPLTANAERAVSAWAERRRAQCSIANAQYLAAVGSVGTV